MFDIEFHRSAIKNSSCWLGISLRRTHADAIGLFVDVLGQRFEKVTEVLANELAQALSLSSERFLFYFYFLPESEPIVREGLGSSPSKEAENLMPSKERRSELRRKGTFLKDAAADFVQRTSTGTCALVLVQNPVWDMPAALGVLDSGGINTLVVRFDTDQAKSNLVLPQGRTLPNDVSVHDYESWDSLERTMKQLGILGGSGSSILFRGANVRECSVLADGREVQIRRESEQTSRVTVSLWPDSDTTTWELRLDSITSDASLSWAGQDARITRPGSTLRLIDIQEDTALKSVIESRRASYWLAMFKALDSIFISDKYQMHQCNCGSPSPTALKCGTCKYVNAHLLALNPLLEVHTNVAYFVMWGARNRLDDYECVSRVPFEVRLNWATLKLEANRWELISDQEVLVESLLSGKSGQTKKDRICTNDEVLCGDLFRVTVVDGRTAIVACFMGYG